MHFAIIVIGSDYESILEPYDENIEVAPYDEGAVSQADQEFVMKKYGLTSLDSVADWLERDWGWHKVNGEWRKYSTYNPNSHWDWYEEGGRWRNAINLKNGSFVDSAKFADIDNIDEIPCYSVVDKFGWYEEMKLTDYLKQTDISDDTIITMVDCHI